MLGEEVAFAKNGEHVRVRVVVAREARLRHRGPRLELEVRAVERRDRPEPAEVEQALDAEDVAVVEAQLALEQAQRLVRDRGVDLEAYDDLGAPAPAQDRFDCCDHPLGAVEIDVVVGVSRHPEREVLHDLHAGEERRQAPGDELLDRHEALAVGKDDEARQDRRNLDAGDAPLQLAGRADDDGKVQGEVRYVREGMRRIDGERRENREDVDVEHLVEVHTVVVVELVPVGEMDAGGCEVGDELVGEDVARTGNESADARPDAAQLLADRLEIRAGAAESGLELHLQAADPHLEELVEVVAEDRHELDALQQRQRRQRREREHALVEVERRQLPVQVAAERAVGSARQKAERLGGSGRGAVGLYRS
jgi:hypothetical protein